MTILMDHISVTGTDLDTLNVGRLTEGTLTGDGVFDILMRIVNTHLLEEYDAGRITGKEYSTVYLGALDSVLQRSVAYILASKQAEQIDAEIGLARQKTVTELAQTSDTIPSLLAFNSSNSIDGLLGQESDINVKRILAAGAEADKINDERALIGQKIATELALTDDTLTGLSINGNSYGFNNSVAVEGTVALEKLNKTAETSLITQKKLTEVQSTALVTEQITKVTSEKNFYDQKTESEKAQTADSVASGTVAGVIGKQKALFDAQTKGFSRDAEQKLLKIMVDPLVARLTGDANTPIPTYMNNDNLNVVMSTAMAGIGANPTTV